MTALYAVWGAEGCGRGIIPLARQQLLTQGIPVSQLVFVDASPKAESINGYQVLSEQAFLQKQGVDKFAVIAIANSRIREKLAKQLKSHGIPSWSVFASNSVVLDDVLIGEGAAISPFVTLTSNIRIGSHFHANLYSYVEHDCVVGDFVTLAPGAKCNGNIVLEDHVYVGAGAVIKQGVPGRPLVIGKGATIGMGAVVTKSVAPGETVVGNPARSMR